MWSRVLKGIESQIEQQTDNWPGMEVHIQDDKLCCVRGMSTGDIGHLEQYLEEKAPKDEGNGEFHTDSSLINNLHVVLQAKVSGVAYLLDRGNTLPHLPNPFIK